MVTTLLSAQTFLAKNQTNEVLLLANYPTTKETLTLPKDLHEIYADSTVTYAGYEEECMRYHGLSSMDGNSQRAMKHDSTLFLTIPYLCRSLRYIIIYHYWTIELPYFW